MFPGETEAVRENNGAGAHARQATGVSDDGFRVERLVGVERYLKRGAGRRCRRDWCFLQSDVFRRGSEIEIPFIVITDPGCNTGGRFRYRAGGNLHPRRVLRGLCAERRVEGFGDLYFLLVAAEPQALVRQIPQHFLERQGNR